MSAQTRSGSTGAKALFRTNIVAQACALLRYVVLARLLGPEQLGVAATLILTAQFLEAISEGGGDRFLIQDRDGDDPRVQQLVHLMSVGRGLFMGLSLLVLAVPLAHFYHRPELAVSFVMLAISPVIGGFLHFDLRRLQRNHDFSREASVMLIGEVVGFTATLIAAFLFRDYTAVIWGMTARSLALVIASWRQAERRYAIGYSSEFARRLGLFAAPLMANGVMLFLGSQGDRLLISNQLGMTELGHYSAVLLLIFYPSQVISRFTQAMQLPLLAHARGDPAVLKARLDDLAGLALVMAVFQVLGFAIVAPFAVPVLFGRAFTLPALVIALIGILQAHRFIRLWPTSQALALGRSSIVLANSSIRLTAFPLAMLGMSWIGGLLGLLLGFILGEMAAFIVAVALSNRAAGLPWFTSFSRVFAFLFVCGAVAFAAWRLSGPPAIAVAAWLVVLVGGGATAWRERRLLLAALNKGLEQLGWRPKRATDGA